MKLYSEQFRGANGKKEKKNKQVFRTTPTALYTYQLRLILNARSAKSMLKEYLPKWKRRKVVRERLTMLTRFYNQRKISVLREKTITSIDGLYAGSYQITFRCSDGTAYKMYHQCDSGEDVFVREVIGHGPKQVRLKTENEITQLLLNRCINSTNMQFYSATSTVDNPLGENESIEIAASTTIYTLQTDAGMVSIIWGGVAYDFETSTEVDFVQTDGDEVWLDGR